MAPDGVNAEAEIADRFWAATARIEAQDSRDREALRLAYHAMLSEIADFLAATVVKQFMAEVEGPLFARFRWKERQRLVRLIARRATRAPHDLRGSAHTTPVVSPPHS